MPKTARQKRQWAYDRANAAPAVPAAVKREVEERANALVETVLTPRYVKPPPENPQRNYLESLSTRWRSTYFYFCAQYRSAGPHAIGGHFELKFARMQYMGNGLFNLAYMRHNDQWFEVSIGLPLEACLARIDDDALFHP